MTEDGGSGIYAATASSFDPAPAGWRRHLLHRAQPVEHPLGRGEAAAVTVAVQVGGGGSHFVPLGTTLFLRSYARKRCSPTAHRHDGCVRYRRHRQQYPPPPRARFFRRGYDNYKSTHSKIVCGTIRRVTRTSKSRCGVRVERGGRPPPADDRLGPPARPAPTVPPGRSRAAPCSGQRRTATAKAWPWRSRSRQRRNRTEPRLSIADSRPISDGKYKKRLLEATACGPASPL